MSVYSNQGTAMKHNLPALREQMSEYLLPQTPTNPSPGRPLSSSFFTAIDPLTLNRQSSLHSYPQYFFPSKLNVLEKGLGVPYAFSHMEASFYWTRDHALANRKLNIWARPPCLNCVVLDDKYAQSCNRYARQTNSRGKIRSCTSCEQAGQYHCCIEQIEIRMDGKVGRIDSEEGTRMWGNPERAHRKKGEVQWIPINLQYGDIELKESIVKGWIKQQRHSISLAERDLDATTGDWPEQEAVRPNLQQTRRLERALKLVAEWDEQDLVAEPQLLMLQAEQDQREAAAEEDKADHLRTEEVGSSLAEDQLYWTNRISVERYEAYLSDVQEVGREVADEFQTVWESQEEDVMSQTRCFLALKKAFTAQGYSEEESIVESRRGLSARVAECLDALVPQIFRPL